MSWFYDVTMEFIGLTGINLCGWRRYTVNGTMVYAKELVKNGMIFVSMTLHILGDMVLFSKKARKGVELRWL